MPRVADDSLVDSIRLYRETLVALRSLYLESAKLLGGSYGWLAGADNPDAAAVAGQMDDLHRGLVMKLFATAAGGLAGDGMHQRQLGRVTLEHLWGGPVMGSRLREAIAWLLAEGESLDWPELVRPFNELPQLRQQWGQLETLVIRAATLLATAEGDHSAGDNARLEALLRQLDAWAEAPLPRQPAAANDPRAALQWLREEARRLRGQAESTSAPARPAAADPTAADYPASPSGPAAAEAQRLPSPAGETGAAKLPATPPEDTRTPQQRLADAQQKLDELIGLGAIKDSIQTLTNFLKMQQQRQEAGLPNTTPSLHMAFVGNPGTGKTSVARIIAEIYGALGILKKGHLVETDRSGLVAEYAGQTGPKTNAKIDEALDGVLFIDEAYSLIDPSGQDQYGREAVQTLLKRMEDQRERLIVILAGYTHEMEAMIRSNPGLSSRVGTTLHFDDYSPEELCRIFALMAGKAQYELPTESRRRLLRGFTLLYATRDRHFGNGRTVRNSFERTVKRLANRLSKLTEVTRELLTTLEPEDIEVAGISQTRLETLAQEPGQVQVTCPHTGKPMVIDDHKLGTEVPSEHGGASFVADWGSPVLAAPASSPNSAAADSPASAPVASDAPHPAGDDPPQR